MKRDLSFQQVSNPGKLSLLSVIIVMIIIIIIIMMMTIIVITMFFMCVFLSLNALTPTTSIFNSK